MRVNPTHLGRESDITGPFDLGSARIGGVTGATNPWRGGVHTGQITVSLRDIDGAVFDVDNTLFLTEPTHREAFRRATQELANESFGRRPIDDHWGRCASAFGKPERRTCETIVDTLWGIFYPEDPSLDDNREFLVHRLADLRAEKFLQGLENDWFRHTLSVIPGARESLEVMAHAGKKIGLATASPERFVRPLLGHFDLESYFEACTFTGDPELKNEKPHPDPYLLTMKRLGLTPSGTLIFEDSASGACAAICSGARVIARVPNRAKFFRDLFPKLDAHGGTIVGTHFHPVGCFTALSFVD